MPEISIVDTKNIIRAIKLKYKKDLGSFPLNSLRYKLDRVLSGQHLRYPDILITRLIEDPDFYYELIDDIYASDMELFRDPEFWPVFTGILSEFMLHQFKKLDILLPVCSNGFELFSLIIFLEEIALSERSQLNVLFNSPSSNKILQSIPGLKPSHIGFENFSKLFPDSDIEKYFSRIDNKCFFRKDKLSHIQKIESGIPAQKKKDQFQLIFFRDRLLNFDTPSQDQLLKELSEFLVKNGILILGYRENPGNFINNSGIFETIDETNRIFKKIV